MYVCMYVVYTVIQYTTDYNIYDYQRTIIYITVYG
jgi:hypothetical protein